MDVFYPGHTYNITNMDIRPIYKFCLCHLQLHSSVVGCSDLHGKGGKVKCPPGKLCHGHIYPITYENQQLLMSP